METNAPQTLQAAPERLFRRLGVGLPYSPLLPSTFFQSGLVDFVEVTPETLCRQARKGDDAAIVLAREQLAVAQQTCADLPMVVHGVELSIGSAHGWNEAYLSMLDEFQSSWPFLWHSEHLSFQTIPAPSGDTLEIGVPLPMPPTLEAVETVSKRASAILHRYQVPFLLENPAHYLELLPADAQIGDEGGLMAAINERSGCHTLLDLHNIYCNSINHRIDAFALLERMPLHRVVEIHIAGGSWQDGFWTDGHNSRVPSAVWDLLRYTLQRTPLLSGIVFETLDEHIEALGADAIAEEVEHARELWNRFQPND